MEDALSLGNSLSRRLFLSNEAISLLEKNTSGKKLLEHYKEFFEKKEILYGHGTGSFVLKNILSSGNIHSDEKLLTGEASTDMITKARETISLVKVDSLHSLFLLELFSFAYEDRKKMVKDFVFKADEGFPVTLFHDISVIQQMKYPEIVKGRVKKMLKMYIIPEKVTQEQIDEAYEKWFRILKGREFFRSKEVEGVLIKALYSLRRSFIKNILPLVSLEGIYTDNITEIVRGLNINTPHTLK